MRAISIRDLREMYDVEMSTDLVSRVADAIVDEFAERQWRPLDRIHPVVFIDARLRQIGH